MSKKVLPRNPKGELFHVAYNKFKDENEYLGKNTKNVGSLMKKITYLVMTSQKYKDRQNNILNTWGAGVDLHFYSDEEGNKTIKVTDKDDYWNLEEKHVNIFKKLKYNFLDKEWFFFCDDDTFVNIKNLSKFAENCDKNSVYGSLINHWQDNTNFYYHSNGAGILLHREVLDKLCFEIKIKMNNFFQVKNINTRYADVTIGLNLLDSGVNMKNDHRFNITCPNDSNIDSIRECLTFHHIKNLEQMQYLHQICIN